MKIKPKLFILVIICLLSSCKHKESGYHNLKEKIEEESKHYQDPGISSEVYIGDIETIEITEGEHTFLIPERKSQLKSYACTECHSKPLSELQQARDQQQAHWEIKIKHANSQTMNCATCHNPGDMNHLNSLAGIEIDFNQSYRLCAQCHSSQFEDWKGGAHGKNIGGWANPRAAMSCVNCHNPHEPQIASKWPVRFNTQKEMERK
ncbi:cytochrome c3 family protein [Poritiphilus flavus]|uniref:Cytochrome C n=1 Tax=Poritiphilus flavus TaxID=2697053 RepID=A0A6L9EG79_9FLAO|nr:cytochrome c3 family protein [Poritiphilus flavus]NAS13652.1 cytochrome C [Poritiphilus flavus]